MTSDRGFAGVRGSARGGGGQSSQGPQVGILFGGPGSQTLGQIQSKSKIAISLVFVAQSTSPCMSNLFGILFWGTMELYTLYIQNDENGVIFLKCII